MVHILQSLGAADPKGRRTPDWYPSVIYEQRRRAHHCADRRLEHCFVRSWGVFADQRQGRYRQPLRASTMDAMRRELSAVAPFGSHNRVASAVFAQWCSLDVQPSSSTATSSMRRVWRACNARSLWHCVAAPVVASRHAVAGVDSGRRPATASAGAAATVIIRARPAHGGAAGPLSRLLVGAAAVPPPDASLVGRVTLFSTLPRTPSVLKESADLQPWMTRMTHCIDTSTFTVTWEDGHLMASLGTRKPDVLHSPNLASRSRFTLTHLGDNNSQNSSGAADFSDDAVAHITDFLISQAALQRWRHQFIGYLLDGKSVAFFVARFEDSPIRGGPRPLVRSQAVDWKPREAHKQSSHSYR